MGATSAAIRPSKITIPAKANPLAKLVFAEMARQRVTYFDLEWKAGVLVSTIKAWRGDNRPGLETLEACLGALGWALVPVPRYDRLPDDIREKLDELAAEWGREEPILHQLLAACCQVPVLNTKPVPARGKRQASAPRGKAPNPLQTTLFGETLH